MLFILSVTPYCKTFGTAAKIKDYLFKHSLQILQEMLLAFYHTSSALIVSCQKILKLRILYFEHFFINFGLKLIYLCKTENINCENIVISIVAKAKYFFKHVYAQILLKWMYSFFFFGQF